MDIYACRILYGLYNFVAKCAKGSTKNNLDAAEIRPVYVKALKDSFWPLF